MSPADRLDWPFPVLPEGERQAHHEAEIALMEWAWSAGFRPYMYGSESFHIGDDAARSVDFIYRGGRSRYWEPVLTDRGLPVRLGPLLGRAEYAAVFLDGARTLLPFAKRWMAGASGGEVLADYDVSTRGPAGPLVLFSRARG